MADGDTSASGLTYELPDADERQSRLSRLYRLAEYHRAGGREVVVVQGLGASGVAWCAAAVLARRDDGSPRYLAVGLDLPRFVSYQNVARLNEGTLQLADPAVAEAMRRALRDSALVATIEDAALSIADYVVVAVGDEPSAPPLDSPMGVWNPRVEGLGPALRAVGRWTPPGALVLLAFGLTPDRIAEAARALFEEASRRGLDVPPPRLAWLVGAGKSGPAVAALDEDSATAAREFLETLPPLPPQV